MEGSAEYMELEGRKIGYSIRFCNAEEPFLAQKHSYSYSDPLKVLSFCWTPNASKLRCQEFKAESLIVEKGILMPASQ